MTQSSTQARPYLDIVAHYERCLELHGDTHRGVDWPRLEDVDTRHRVMLDVIRPSPDPVRLLDFGCGAAHLYEYIERRGIPNIRYSGLDLSERFVELSRSKHPHLDFHCVDVLDPAVRLPEFDYVVMNGVFTEKRTLTQEQMREYFEAVVSAVFQRTRVGIAFNVMSSHVDWTRDDLFHLPMDELAAFAVRRLTRNFVIRNDYGLYEYTAYIYR